MKNKVILRFIIPPALIISFAIYVIFSLSTKNSSPPSQSGWVLQTDLQSQLRGRTISDMTFTDSVTGYAVNLISAPNDTGFIFKTTNGGENWFVNYYSTYYFRKIAFIGDSLGFALGGSGGSTPYICKTTNKGNNWFILNCPFGSLYWDISILNKDTIYIIDNNSLVGGIFRTTNGGQNWQQIYAAGQYNPYNIYMYNARIGFYSDGSRTWKTTDGGFNWTQINNKGFTDIHFLDSLIGFRISPDSTGYGRVQKTINGGFNWIVQMVPHISGATTFNDLNKFYFASKDTIYAIGSYVWYPNPARSYGLIYKTTNGGINWGYQIPDTHIITMPLYNVINFYGKKFGWVYWNLGKGVHTTVGGDTTFYTNIKEQSNKIISEFILYQNYPNPFNAMTNIKYQISNSKYVLLKIYDISGKEINTLVNKKQSAGTYEVKFDGSNLSSGIYFYSLFIEGMIVDTKKLILLK
jgi:photosystem II stability/assembly factor-like uncharacterized protein